MRDLVDLRLRIASQGGTSREVLPQQQIGVFIGAALPGTWRIAEVDLHIGSYRNVFLLVDRSPILAISGATVSRLERHQPA